MNSDLTQAQIYTDFQGLNELKYQAHNDQDKTLRAVAEQFEAIFLQMVLKSMRDANDTFKSDLFNSSDIGFYETMHDQQLSLTLSKSGTIGIADLLVQQLGQNQNQHQAQNQAAPAKLNEFYDNLVKPIKPFEANHQENDLKALSDSNSIPQPINQPQDAISFQTPKEFISGLWDEAQRAASKIDLSPKLLLAQAALETGWGKAIALHKDGRSSYNLFGIKANKASSEDKVIVNTLEYEQGIAHKKQQPFRSYQSFTESFNDYINLIASSPRYTKALQETDKPDSYMNELQDAGYATDPSYAEKVLKVFSSKIFNGWD